MWISNTATTAMMMPMVEAVLDQIKPEHKDLEEEDEAGGELDMLDTGHIGGTHHLQICMCLPALTQQFKANAITGGKISSAQVSIIKT